LPMKGKKKKRKTIQLWGKLMEGAKPSPGAWKGGGFPTRFGKEPKSQGHKNSQEKKKDRKRGNVLIIGRGDLSIIKSAQGKHKKKEYFLTKGGGGEGEPQDVGAGTFRHV